MSHTTPYAESFVFQHCDNPEYYIHVDFFKREDHYTIDYEYHYKQFQREDMIKDTYTYEEALQRLDYVVYEICVKLNFKMLAPKNYDFPNLLETDKKEIDDSIK